MRYIQTFFANQKHKYFTIRIICDSYEDELKIDNRDSYDKNITSSLNQLLEVSLKETEQRKEER